MAFPSPGGRVANARTNASVLEIDRRAHITQKRQSRGRKLFARASEEMSFACVCVFGVGVVFGCDTAWLLTSESYPWGVCVWYKGRGASETNL